MMAPRIVSTPSGAAPQIECTGLPSDTDWSRWVMLHDGSDYRIYAFKFGSNTQFYQGAYDGNSYAYGYNSIPILNLVYTLANSNLRNMSMLYDGQNYRLYLQAL